MLTDMGQAKIAAPKKAQILITRALSDDSLGALFCETVHSKLLCNAEQSGHANCVSYSRHVFLDRSYIDFCGLAYR